MPMMQYLSMNKPVFSDEWQAFAVIAVVIIGIISAGIVLWETRKW